MIKQLLQSFQVGFKKLTGFDVLREKVSPPVSSASLLRPENTHLRGPRAAFRSAYLGEYMEWTITL